MNTAVATTKPKKSTALITLDPKEYVATAYEPYVAALSAAIATVPETTYDVATRDGMALAKEARARFRDVRIGLEKCRAEKKAPVLEIGKLLDSRAKEIAKEIEPYENRFDAAIKAEEARIEAEKQEKARIEGERQARIQARIDEIKNAPLKAINAAGASIKALLDSFSACYLDDENLAERLDEAKYVLKETVTQLQSMYQGKLAQEQLAAQQEAARLESERVASELAVWKAAEEKSKREAMAAEEARLRIEREAIKRREEEIARKQREMAERERLMVERETRAEAERVKALEASIRAQEAARLVTADLENEAADSGKPAETASVAPAAAPSTPEPEKPLESPQIVARPSDAAILGVLSRYYAQPEEIVLGWLHHFDLAEQVRRLHS